MVGEENGGMGETGKRMGKMEGNRKRIGVRKERGKMKWREMGV